MRSAARCCWMEVKWDVDEPFGWILVGPVMRQALNFSLSMCMLVICAVNTVLLLRSLIDSSFFVFVLKLEASRLWTYCYIFAMSNWEALYKFLSHKEQLIFRLNFLWNIPLIRFLLSKCCFDANKGDGMIWNNAVMCKHLSKQTEEVVELLNFVCCSDAWAIRLCMKHIRGCFAWRMHYERRDYSSLSKRSNILPHFYCSKSSPFQRVFMKLLRIQFF